MLMGIIWIDKKTLKKSKACRIIMNNLNHFKIIKKITPVLFTPMFTPILFVLTMLFGLLNSGLASAAPNTRSPMGINTNEIMDTTASIPFVDVFKTSLPFEEGRPWITKGKVTYDKYG